MCLVRVHVTNRLLRRKNGFHLQHLQFDKSGSVCPSICQFVRPSATLRNDIGVVVAVVVFVFRCVLACLNEGVSVHPSVYPYFLPSVSI